MTQFLIRCFIKRPDDVKDAAVRTAYGNLASLVGMACNILLCIGKLLAGTLFGSIAIMADALNNLSDASSNVVSLIGFRLAAKAPDAEHPYGHARYEYLAGLVVSVTILAIGLSLLKESALKVLHPTPVVFSWLSIGVLAASILVKLWLSGFNRAVGKKDQLGDPDGYRRRQPQRCADHRSGPPFHHPVQPDGLRHHGWHYGRGRGGVHPLVRMGPGDGYPEPAAGREPQPRAGGAH